MSGINPHIPQKASKNLLLYIGKLGKYINYLEKSYGNCHRTLCDTNDEFNEILKLKTKSINQFQQLTERSNKATSDLGITKVELAAAKEKREEYKREAKSLKAQLVQEKKTKKLEERVTTSLQPIHEPIQVTLQKLKVEQMDKELALEKVKADAAILVDRNKVKCQDQLHNNKVRRNLDAKETERDSLKEKKKDCHSELMLTSNSNSFGFVSIICLVFPSFVSSMSI